MNGSLNGSNVVPAALQFNNTNLAKIICNAIFFFFSFCGNVPLFCILIHNLRRRPNRVQVTLTLTRLYIWFACTSHANHFAETHPPHEHRRSDRHLRFHSVPD